MCKLRLRRLLLLGVIIVIIASLCQSLKHAFLHPESQSRDRCKMRKCPCIAAKEGTSSWTSCTLRSLHLIGENSSKRWIQWITSKYLKKKFSRLPGSTNTVWVDSFFRGVKKVQWMNERTNWFLNDGIWEKVIFSARNRYRTGHDFSCRNWLASLNVWGIHFY